MKVLKLTTLETRRKRGDLIQFYKALNGLDQIKWTNELSMIEKRVNVRNGRFCFHRELHRNFKAGLDRLESFST